MNSNRQINQPDEPAWRPVPGTGREEGASGYVAVFIQHRAALVDYAGSITGCHTGAEDVAQDAFIRFAAAAEDGNVQRPVSFLYRVVRNLAIDHVRREARRAPAPFTDAQLTALPDETPDAERVLHGRRRIELVQHAISELPPRTRRIFFLKRLDDLKYREIADAFGMSVSNVQRHVVRAHAHAAARIGDSR